MADCWFALEEVMSDTGAYVLLAVGGGLEDVIFVLVLYAGDGGLRDC